jgi:hypothetical protein
MAELLIPRATAYGAGFIDHFFRGRLEIQPPDEGVYAVIDHSQTNKKDSDGFKSIKLKLRNITPAIVEPSGTFPQEMAQGTLVAVAKFRRNVCYKSDLEGEFRPPASENDPKQTWNGCLLKDYRTADEEILVSKPIVDVVLSSSPDTPPKAYTFTFETPIPINATDLKLQVVYRGVLGSEQDAVVVATKDLREPTYFSFFNGSDFFMVDRQFYSYAQIESDPDLFQRASATSGLERLDALDLTDMTFWFKPTKPVLAVAHLAPGTYFRVSYLTDSDDVKINYRGIGYRHTQYLIGVHETGLIITSASTNVESKKNYTEFQAVNRWLSLPEDIAAPVRRARSHYFWQEEYFFQHNEGATATIPKDIASSEIDKLPPAVEVNPKTIRVVF